MPAVEIAKAERLFIGIPIPERTRESLARQLPQSLPGKAAPIGNWHFTLKFLGSTEPVHRDRLIDQLRKIRFGRAFEIAFDTLGAFPNPRRARILWAGVGKGRERLESVAERVEAAAIAAGFPPDERRFNAHLTLSRLNPPQSVGHIFENAKKLDAHMLVDEINLYRSELGGAHSKYTVVESLRLD